MKTAGMLFNKRISNHILPERNLLHQKQLIKGYPDVNSTQRHFDTLIKNFDYIAGHFHFPLHRSLRQAEQAAGYTVVDFTLLRDPLERVVSLYNYYVKDFYLSEKPVEQFHGSLNHELFVRRQVSFSEFIRLQPVHSDNFQTRFLANLPADQMWSGTAEITRKDFDAARHNLASFAVVGVQKNANTAWRQICQRCGWPFRSFRTRVNDSVITYNMADDALIPIHMRNISVDTLSDADRDHLEQANRFDRQLFDDARALSARK